MGRQAEQLNTNGSLRRFTCPECDRADLSLTAKDLLRVHTADGKRQTGDNPKCSGSGGEPRDDVAEDTPEREVTDVPLPDPEGIEDPSTAAAAGAVVHTLPPRPPCPGCGHAEHSGECGAAWTGSAGEIAVCGCRADIPITGAAPAAPVADERCEWSGTGRHVWRFGECVCEAKQPGYVAPPEGATAPVTAAQGAGDSFLMGTGRGPHAAGGAVDMLDSIDALMADDPPSDGSDKLYKNGRYALPDPLTGNPRTWTRATTMAETCSDLYSLNLWRIRMMIIGIVRNPELLEGLAELDAFDPETGEGKLSPKVHKDMLNRIGFRAQTLAGSKVPASWGTQMHLNIERLSRDEITTADVPEKYQSEVTAWAAAMSEADLSAVPHLIERRVAVPMYGTAGTLDQIDRVNRSRSIRLGSRIVRLSAGEHVVGDVKSGRDLDYGWGEISIQMAIYAHGAREGLVARWDQDAEDGSGAWVWEDIGIPPKSIRKDVGVVMHVPVGGKQCTLHWIDLEEGWRAAQLCDSVRDWRKAKGLHAPFSIAEVPTGDSPARPVVRQPDWDELFGSVTTKDQASQVYRRWISSGGTARTPEATRLVALAKRHLSQLEESTA
jgi:hypothetical protein